MKVMLALYFSFFIFEILADDCPPECPSKNLPTVKDGKIIVTVFYDNDPEVSTEKPNTELIKIVCDAMDAFGDELEVHFKVGARSMEGVPNDPIQFYCHNNCGRDCEDACAAKYIGFSPTQVCCSKRGRDFYECAAEQGLTRATMNDKCFHDPNLSVCKEVLLGNSNIRKSLDIPDCQLPIVLYNGKTDRCSKFKNSAEFIQILCGIFKRGNMNPKPCKA